MRDNSPLETNSFLKYTLHLNLLLPIEKQTSGHKNVPQKDKKAKKKKKKKNMSVNPYTINSTSMTRMLRAVGIEMRFNYVVFTEKSMT